MDSDAYRDHQPDPKNDFQNRKYNLVQSVVGEPLRNLNGDAMITGHDDVCKPEIAYALLRAIGASASA